MLVMSFELKGASGNLLLSDLNFANLVDNNVYNM